MCFLSAGPRRSQSHSAKGRKRDRKLQKFEEWRLKMSQRDSVFFEGFFLASFLFPPLRSYESVLPHGAGQGVTVLEPSSHCVHPLNFHLRMRAILRLSLLKINPQTRRGCDVEESRCGKLSYASPHVKIRQMWHTAHWITQTSAASFQRCEVSTGGGGNGVASLPLFHTLTPLPGLDTRSRKAKCSQLACRIQPGRRTSIRQAVPARLCKPGNWLYKSTSGWE